MKHLCQSHSQRFACKSSPIVERLTERNIQPTGKESLVEKWILHKLNFAATEVNKHLTDRNFMFATIAVYNFWLYELCDVYIVGSTADSVDIPDGLS